MFWSFQLTLEKISLWNFQLWLTKNIAALNILLGKKYFGKPKDVIAHQIPIRYVLQLYKEDRF